MIASFSLRHVTAGLTAVVVGYSSAVVIVIDLARKAGANDDMIISWLLALGLGMGVSCIIFSWLTKMPVVTAWSTPGAAFLMGNVGNYSLSESIGAFVVCALLSLATAQSTLLLNAIKRIPPPISSALLAGILLPICLAVFVDVDTHPFIVFIYLAAYILGSLFFARYLMLMLLVLSITVSYLLQGAINIHFTAPIPVWVTPTFSLSATIGLAIPLFIITTLSQNLPGIAIHHAHGYTPPHKPILSGIALIQLVLAPFGGFTFNLAAITAALCMGKDADPDKTQRYKAGIMAGFGYLLMGALASLVVVLFVAMPAVVVHLLAGLALLATLKTSLAQSLRDEQHRHAALVTFLCTASGFTFLTISSAVWGLLLGLILMFVERQQK